MVTVRRFVGVLLSAAIAGKITGKLMDRIERNYKSYLNNSKLRKTVDPSSSDPINIRGGTDEVNIPKWFVKLLLAHKENMPFVAAIFIVVVGFGDTLVDAKLKNILLEGTNSGLKRILQLVPSQSYNAYIRRLQKILRSNPSKEHAEVMANLNIKPPLETGEKIAGYRLLLREFLSSKRNIVILLVLMATYVATANIPVFLNMMAFIAHKIKTGRISRSIGIYVLNFLKSQNIDVPEEISDTILQVVEDLCEREVNEKEELDSLMEVLKIYISGPNSAERSVADLMKPRTFRFF